MKKPRWYRDSILDKLHRNAPGRFHLAWMTVVAWFALAELFNRAGLHPAFVGVMALVGVIAAAIVLSWSTLYF